MRVRFSSERVSIEGCNWWGFEPWSVEDGRLVTIDNQPDGTLIGCSEAADSQDRWLVGFLRSGPALAIDADTVTVSGGDTVISLVYEGTAQPPVPPSAIPLFRVPSKRVLRESLDPLGSPGARLNSAYLSSMSLSRSSARLVPWLFALVGLAIPLVGSGFALWLPICGWLIALLVVWLVGGQFGMARQQRIGAAVILLPVLFLAGFEGGWWLIPADLAWLVIEFADRSPRDLAQPSGDSRPGQRNSSDPLAPRQAAYEASGSGCVGSLVPEAFRGRFSVCTRVVVRLVAAT